MDACAAIPGAQVNDASKRNFCRVLDVAMHNSGTTGREIASALGVSETHVSNVRSGKRAPFTIEALRTLGTKRVLAEHYVAHLIAAREHAFVLPVCNESDRELYGLGLNLMLDWQHLSRRQIERMLTILRSTER
jgi:predicted XRE-type DNA-binding protein